MTSLFDLVTKPLDVASDAWADVLRRAGPGPVGDPAELRAHAAFLASQGELIRGHARRLRAGHTHLDFEGPAANRHRYAIERLVRQLELRASGLDAIAQQLRGRAEQLDHERWRYRAHVLGILADELR